MHKEITLRLIKELRGTRDYKTISEQMGVSYGQFFKLENGYSRLKFDEFVNICSTIPEIDLKAILEKELHVKLETLNQFEVMEQITISWGGPSAYILKERLEWTSSKWWRIKNGKTRMFFDEFIKLIGSIGCDSNKFLLNFLSEDTIKMYATKSPEIYQNEMKIMEKHPDACQITCVIGDRAYVKSDVDNKTELLRAISKLDKERFYFLLNLLMDNKVIYFDNEENIYKKHVLKLYLKPTDTDTYLAGQSLRRHIIQKQIEMMEDPGHDRNRIKSSFGVGTISKTAFEKVKKEILSSFHTINKIIEEDNLQEDEPMELMMIQLGAFYVEESAKVSRSE